MIPESLCREASGIPTWLDQGQLTVPLQALLSGSIARSWQQKSLAGTGSTKFAVSVSGYA